MANLIKWDSEALAEVSGEIARIENDYDSMAAEIRGVLNGLDWKVSVSSTVDDKVRALSGEILDESNKITALRSLVSTACSKVSTTTKTLTDILPIEQISQNTNIATPTSIYDKSPIKAMLDWLRSKAIIPIAPVIIPPQILPSIDALFDSISDVIRPIIEDINQPIQDMQNLGVVSSYTYGEGDIWHVVAYSKDKNYSADDWTLDGASAPVNSSAGCAIASIATAVSSLGVHLTPADLVSTIGKGDVVINHYNIEGLNYSGYGVNSILSQQPGLSQQDAFVAEIDSMLEKYISDPDKYAPPIMATKGSSSHYVTITGKNPDGSYNVLDSSGYYITGYTPGEGYDLTGKGKDLNPSWGSKITSIYQYSK